jgi:hypothetical protein
MAEIKYLELLKKIIEGATDIKCLAYYTYKTGTVGSSYIAEDETKSWNTSLAPNDSESEITNIVDLLINFSVKELRVERDNKTAVECAIKGINVPVYFCIFDNKRIICTEIRPEGEPMPLSNLRLSLILPKMLVK